MSDLWIIQHAYLSLLPILVFTIMFSRLNLLFQRSPPHKKAPSTQYPQGPRPWPLLGNFVYLMRIFQRPDIELRQLAAEYGSMTMMWFGVQPVLIINTAREARELLVNKGHIYSDRPSPNGFRRRYWPWRLAAQGVGPEFRWLRSINHRLLSHKQSLKLRKNQEYESVVLLNRILDEPKSFFVQLERFTISVLFSAVYGTRLNDLDHPIMLNIFQVWEEILRFFQPGTMLIDFFPFLEKLPEVFQPWIRIAQRLRARDSALHQAFLNTVKKQIAQCNAPSCFAAHLIEMQENGEAITEEQMIGIMSMVIGAGSDTTSGALQVFYKVLAMNPSALNTAQEEIDRVVGPSRLPTWDDEADLPYLRALIKEMHRWAPITSLGVPHATTVEDTHAGFKVPRGTTVFANYTAIHRDADLYGDPHVFRPERYFHNTLSASSSANHPDYRQRDHIHYGFGRRICQGIHVAESALFIVLARTIWGFNLSPARSSPPLRLEDKIQGLLTKPKPFEIEMTPRSAEAKELLQACFERLETDVLDFDAVELDK